MSLLEDCASAAAFDAHLASSDAVVCHYWASWCEPCGAMDELMRELAASHPGAKFVRVEAEEVDELAERYDVSAVPFFTFHKNAALVDKLEGAAAGDLAPPRPPPPPPPRPPSPPAPRGTSTRASSSSRRARPSCSS
jgi:thiol-disulfide isomerase/thioredoxin